MVGAKQKVLSSSRHAEQIQQLSEVHGHPPRVTLNYGRRSCSISAAARTASSAEVASIGLIVAELVINAFKHAFVGDRASGQLVVAYEVTETSWRLAVSDNGRPSGFGEGNSWIGHDHRRGTRQTTRRSCGDREEPTRHDSVDHPWNVRLRLATPDWRRKALAAEIKGNKAR